MTRCRWIYRDGIAYELGTQPVAERAGPDIVGDITPYKSMIDGSIIQSRSQHREHLRDHGCVEVGNEAMAAMKYYDNLPDVAPQQRRELIRAQFDAISHDDMKRMIKRDADRVKWNSRRD